MFLVLLRVFFECSSLSAFFCYSFSGCHAFRGRWNYLRVIVDISGVFQVFFKLSWSLLVFSLFSMFFEFVGVFEIFSVFRAFRGWWNYLRVLVGISCVFLVFFKLSWSLLVFS